MYVKYFLCLKHIQTSLLDKYVEMIVQHKTLIQKYICCKMSHCHITTCVDQKGLKIERFKPPLKKISGLDLDMNNIQSVLQYKYFCVYWHVPVLTGVVWCPTDIYVNFYAILLYITEMRCVSTFTQWHIEWPTGIHTDVYNVTNCNGLYWYMYLK